MLHTMRMIIGLVVGAIALLGSACTPLNPTMPMGPPPRLEDGLLLMVVPEEFLRAGTQATVKQDLVDFMQVELDEVDQRDRLLDPATLARIARHEILTGMPSRQVIWAFGANPTRQQDTGPPGGQTLYWEPGRYWVRFDELGRAVSAGRY
jgi:hypothetical protein